MSGREFVYTLGLSRDDDSVPEDFKEPVHCERCGDPVDLTDLYVYKGGSYHEKCLPEPAKEVATRGG